MFAKSLIQVVTLASSTAWASQEFGILNETGLTKAGSRLLPEEDGTDVVVAEEPVVKLTCKERAQAPGDKCYFKSEAYFAKSKEDKMNELWAEILKDDEPMAYYWSEFPNFFTQKANGSFCQRSDILNKKRLKTTHTQGVVGQVEWVPVDNDEGYTGIYKSGSDAVLIRLSQTVNLIEASSGLFPSMALKFLRDNDEAENLFAQTSRVLTHGTSSVIR